MGASLVYLEKPNKDKHSHDASDTNFTFGAWEMQGWRLNMEDAMITNFDFADDMHLFGVFDGHGGKEASYVVKDHYERILKETEEFKAEDYEGALKSSFFKMDEYLDSTDGKNDMKKVADASPETKSPLMKLLTGGGEEAKAVDVKSEESYMLDSKGCTANVALIQGNKVIVANAGDSRCVLAHKHMAIDLSKDHKPEDEIEKKRILAAGSEIREGRVDGNLNLSRSLGDLKHKQKPGLKPEEQPITCDPDITTHELKEDDDFIVMAWDGIWEVKSSQEVVDFIYERINEKKLSAIIEELFESIISPDYTETQGLGCDNMSCLILALKKKVT